MSDARRRLEAERARVAAQASELEAELESIVSASQDVALDDEHDPDGATVGFERARVTALLENARRRQAALDDAMARVEADTYGVCVGCGLPIAAERLAAVPDAIACTACAAAGRVGPTT